MLAAVRRFRPVLWAKAIGSGNKLLYAGLAALLIAAVSAIHQFSLISCTLTFPLFAASFALLLTASASSRSLLGRLRVPGVQTVALLSYAIYLTHTLALHLSDLVMTRINFPLLRVPITLILVFGFASALYFLVERPFLMLRDRWFGPAAARVVELANVTALL